MNSSFINLLKRRGISRVSKKAFLMSRFHGVIRPQFKNSLRRFIQVLDRNDVKCTFPIVAEVARRNRDVIRMMLDSGNEVATHGLIHISFSGLPYEEQFSMLKRSIDVLEELTGSEIDGVRIPYAPTCDENTFKAALDAGLKYDSTTFSPMPTKPRMIAEAGGRYLLEFSCLITETSLIDDSRLSPNELIRVWVKEIERTGEGQFAVMDAHPVRMGTQRYVFVMEELIRYCKENGFDVLNLREAYEKFRSGRAKGRNVVLTGDIDCVSIWDYVRRMWKKA